ncbi:MAG: EF-hand domain-containing protein [Rhodanobacteraceae bacterium]
MAALAAVIARAHAAVGSVRMGFPGVDAVVRHGQHMHEAKDFLFKKFTTAGHNDTSARYWSRVVAGKKKASCLHNKERTMKYTMMFGAIAFTALAGCSMMSSGTHNGTMGENTGTTMAPADEQASTPGNVGNGLAYGMSPEDAARVFKTLDVNHDGFVSREEFMANGDSGQRFPGCDTNGDGKLTEAEFVQCAERPATTGQ